MLEGVKVLEEALDAGLALEGVYTAPDYDGPVVQQALAAGARVRALAPGVLEKVTDTVTPQPVVAVAPYCDASLDDLADAASVLVAVDVRDPGNAGTVIRTAEAAGVGGLVFCDGSVDVFNPKTVRASAGSLFHVPVVRGGEVTEVLDRLGGWGMQRVATVARGGRAHDLVDLTSRHALVIGNEAHGLPDAVRERVDLEITIPIAGRAESLNVSMAAAVVCFEAARQRRAAEAAS